MRGKKAIRNTVFAFIQELVAVISGFIVPRLILASFGSTYNGLTSSITQFLGVAVLLRAGLGGATRAALYKPLAEGDMGRVNAIMSATDKYMKKIALILAGTILAFSCIYPFFVADEFDWFFTFTLFLIIGFSTFAESFFGITYLIIVQADQNLYIASIARSISYVLNTIIAAILIKNGFGIHIVKLGSAISFAIYPIFLNLYAKKKYRINLKVKPDNNSISQRWDAFWHQIATFAMNNTDTIVLTAFRPIAEVSVYSVYNLVVNGLRKLVSNFTNGLEAAFGNMIAKDDNKVLRDNFEIVQYMIFSVATVVYTSAGLLVLSFVRLYTRNVNDIDYIRPEFALVIMIAQFFNCIRQPYQLVVQAAGHYKQTKKGAIIEPILNIGISVVLVIQFGLVGVAIGTLAATLFRTVQYTLYVNKNLISGVTAEMIKGCLISGVEVALVVAISFLLNFSQPESYMMWIVNGIIVASITIIIVILVSFIFNRKYLMMSVHKVMGILKKKR